MNFSFPTKSIESEYDFGAKLDSEYRENMRRCPSVCYRYLQLDGKYGFDQDAWDKRDIVAYFDSMNILSELCIDEFWELDSQQWHLHKNDIFREKNLSDLIKSTIGKNIRLTPETTPIFFHFALYQDRNVIADRKTGIKSPRIYLFIGENAKLYPLFYDPYHEINPM